MPARARYALMTACSCAIDAASLPGRKEQDAVAASLIDGYQLWRPACRACPPSHAGDLVIDFGSPPPLVRAQPSPRLRTVAGRAAGPCPCDQSGLVVMAGSAAKICPAAGRSTGVTTRRPRDDAG